jgi:hypothetical protein
MSLFTQVNSVYVEPLVKAALQKATSSEMPRQAYRFEVVVAAYCRANGYPLDGLPIDTPGFGCFKVRGCPWLN